MFTCYLLAFHHKVLTYYSHAQSIGISNITEVNRNMFYACIQDVPEHVNNILEPKK